MKNFNINNYMYIQITDEGWEFLKIRVGEDYIENYIIPKQKEINNEIWYKLQCYDVFDLLPIKMGSPLYFKTNVLFDDKGIT